MEVLDQQSFLELKRAALTRRAQKFINWLSRPEYGQYLDVESPHKLSKTIEIICSTLDRSFEENDWKPFERDFMKAKAVVDDYVKTEGELKANFYSALEMVNEVLSRYMEFLNHPDKILASKG